MRNPLAAHPAWRQLLIATVVLPLIIVLAVLAFAWPAARIQPRSIPVGIVGATPATQQLVKSVSAARPGGFDFRLYATDESASAAIRHRDVYGAFSVSSTGVTVLEASAASPSVAQILASVGQDVAGLLRSKAEQPMSLRIQDIVPTSPADPKGLILSSALLPMTICSIIVAAALGLVIGFHPAWRQAGALVLLSAAAGLGAYLIAQGFLGALPHGGVWTWAALSLTVLAMTSATGGLIALAGTRGLAVSAAMFVFLGNPFSGATSAPDLLPPTVSHLGQWLPPGAGTNLLRSTAYFGGNGAGSHVAVLLAWTIFGLAAVVAGHHTSPRFAAHPAHRTMKAQRLSSADSGRGSGGWDAGDRPAHRERVAALDV